MLHTAGTEQLTVSLLPVNTYNVSFSGEVSTPRIIRFRTNNTAVRDTIQVFFLGDHL